MPKIPLFLVTGFLGSGKTTFLREIIRQHGEHTSIGIIQNEFAPANIDGEVLNYESDNPFHILEINKGSVFCVCLLNDFVSSAIKFLETYKPEALFIEASGLSDPIAIAQIISKSKLNTCVYLAQTWCLVDGSTYFTQTRHNTQLKHQIEIADTLIINKADRAGDIDEIRNSLRGINPLAKIEVTTFARLNKIELHKPFGLLPRAFQAGEHSDIPRGSNPPDIEFVVYRSHKPLLKEDIKALFETRNNLGEIMRAKGFVITPVRANLIHLQYASGHLNMQVLPNNNKRMQSEVIILGHNLNEKGIIHFLEATATKDK
ncbi:MAG: CobW family GTP-binding protein [Bacteroidota bacterium]